MSSGSGHLETGINNAGYAFSAVGFVPFDGLLFNFTAIYDMNGIVYTHVYIGTLLAWVFGLGC